MKLVMMRGLPASGKSTVAREMVDNGTKHIPHPSGQVTTTKVVRVNKDEIRARLNKPWSHDQEREVLRIRDFEICQALSKGHDVISDDTNLAPKHETRLRDLAKKYKAEFVIQSFLDVPIEECIERDKLREYGKVGEKVIRDMYNTYLGPQPVVSKSLSTQDIEVKAAYFNDPSLPPALICDLDGTLALSEGLRGTFEHNKAADDMVNAPILRIIQNFYADDHEILYVSGREAKYRPQTVEFLTRCNAPWAVTLHLFMRETSDKRNDTIVKRELFNANIAGKYYVNFVLDDRDRVVKMWRDLGLTCLQVNYGTF